jgi:tRNA-2-methylthio-N6-dimethylallyladenosine synthase
MLKDNDQTKSIDEQRQGEVFEWIDTKPRAAGKKVFIESYGCQMNFNDSEIVASILAKEGYIPTQSMEESDLILVNTCSIREKAEDTVRKRLHIYNKAKKSNPSLVVGVLGCMAERLKDELLDEKMVDIVVGPDAYRDLPQLIDGASHGNKGINVLLSKEETYDDIEPVRIDSNGVTAFISIMRGCDNMCSFCVVPFTRGRERSRDAYSILSEAVDLFEKGYREVTLLGQNVDSYHWTNPETQESVDFAQLLEMVAEVSPLLRVRFATSHPKDITDEVIYTIARHKNICDYIHFPVQSGNSRVLKLMNRTYDREWYLERVKKIYEVNPEMAISADIIAGFCTETEEEHKDTLSIMQEVNYSMSYMFYYSERPRTYAARRLKDDVPLETKKRRLNEIIQLQNKLSLEHNQKDIGKTFEVLIEGNSRKSEAHFKGRNSQNKMIVFPKNGKYQKGDYVMVKVHEASSATLKGTIVT